MGPPPREASPPAPGRGGSGRSAAALLFEPPSGAAPDAPAEGRGKRAPAGNAGALSSAALVKVRRLSAEISTSASERMRAAVK